MNCQSCGHQSSAANRFCEECGAALVRRCGNCGSDVSPTAKFCGACGASLVAGPIDKVEARKIVTIVFADLIGSTSLHERLDPESVSRVMERYHGAVRAPVEAHGGTVVQLLGDGVMCAFGVPKVAEDDAIRAVRAAVAIQQAFREFAREHAELVGNVGLRVAVNTGEVVVSDDYAAGIGDPLNVAARLQQEAGDGDVLIGESTQRLVRDQVTLEPFGVFQLKGRAESVAAYRVVSLERPAGVPATPFVGRDDELRRIMGIFDSAVTARRAQMAVILGSPGLGKSRLIDEVSRRLGGSPREVQAGSPYHHRSERQPGESGSPGLQPVSAPSAQPRATVLTAHCDAAGGATFAPIAEALHRLLRATDDAGNETLRAAIEAMLGDESERARIAAGIVALLGNEPAAPEETFFVVRRFLASLAAAQPVVLVIDDLQWAEPLLLDLTEHLVQWSTGAPLFVLVAARPELRDVRSSLTVPGGLANEVLTLGGLDAAAATRLAANVIGAEQLPAALAGRVLATSEGNPLFLGELVRMLVHDGALKREGDRWTAAVELADLEMPPTIQALLAARIERLRPEERTVLERAAVVGRHFSRSAVAHLLPREIADLDLHLEALRRSELVEPAAGWFMGEPMLRFHHVLIRDAAYRRLLKETRAELHGRLADWIESRVGAAIEHDETIGWHLEQAHQNLRELGPLDAHGRAFGERAAHYLGAAGRRALARDDLPLAASLLGRAIDRLDASDPARADLALDWCEALLAVGEVGHARQAIEELGRFAVQKGLGGYGVTGLGANEQPTLTPNPLTPNPLRLSAWHTCLSGQLAVLTDPQALHATADAVAVAAEEFAALGDTVGEAKAHSVHALALSRLGKIGACEAALDRALGAARRAGDRRRASAVLAGAPVAALWGPSPVTRASGRCLDVVRVLRITQGAPAVEAVALRCQAVLEALRGRIDAGRRMIASSRAMLEELGITQRILETDVSAGLIELLDGDPVEAERYLRAAYEGLRGHGLAIDAAQAAALLGRALLAQGRQDEAEQLSHESEALAGDDLKAAIAWRGVRAEALARRGEHAQALDLARAAVDIAAATDALLDHADARLALATALRAAGRNEPSDVEEKRAIELWEAKGAALLAARARRDGRVLPTGSLPLAKGGQEGFGAEPFEQIPLNPPFVKGEGRSQRRIRANAATACWPRFDAAVKARDLDTLTTLVANDVEVVHHPTGATIRREEGLNRFRLLFRTEELDVSFEGLATLGAYLLLGRDVTSFTRFVDDQLDFGESRSSYLNLFEVDDRGRVARVEIFAENRLGEAVSRLYERHAELLSDGLSADTSAGGLRSAGGSGPPAGSEYDRAAATARSVAAVVGPFDLERYAPAIAPAAEFVDHRTLGFPPAHGPDELLRSIGSLLETADNVGTRVDDVLALGPDGFLVRWTTFGTHRLSRGPFEWQFLRLCVFGADGLLTRAEQFDPDDAERAIARFDQLVARPPEPPAVRPTTRFASAGSRFFDRFNERWQARDWEGIVDTYTPDTRLIDRRSLTGLDLQGSDFIASLRVVFDLPANRWHGQVLATRGESLALGRWRVESAGDTAGPSEVEYLGMVEVDASGRGCLGIVFDLDDLDAAYAELDDRYAAGEAAPFARVATTLRAFAAAVAARDWDALESVFVPSLVVYDHRPLGWETLHGPAMLVATFKSLVELAPDVRLRIDHVTVSANASLALVAFVGMHEGGAFEDARVVVHEFDEHGKIRRHDIYGVDHLDEAKSRFDQIVAQVLLERSSR